MIVKDGKNRTVAKRDFPIDPGLRCLCVSICACICFPALLTTEASKLCEKMTPQDGYNAGFLNSELEEYDMEDTISLEPRVFIAVPICVCIFLLLMGKFSIAALSLKLLMTSANIGDLPFRSISTFFSIWASKRFKLFRYLQRQDKHKHCQPNWIGSGP